MSKTSEYCINKVKQKKDEYKNEVIRKKSKYKNILV